MKKYTQQLFLFVVLCFAGGQLAAQATLSIQGTIQESFGAAVPNGDYDLTFKLYTTETGGTALWTETQTLRVVGGVYSALLGSVNPLSAAFDQAYFLGVKVGTDPELTPRMRLTSSPYALALLGQDNQFPSTGMVKMSALATGQETTTATSYTVGADDHVIYLDHTANQNVTLPAATAANAGRNLMLVNKEAVAKTLTSSNYVNLEGATSTTIPAKSAIDLQSDGSVWRQTGGYVTPGAKAYVLATISPTANYPASAHNNLQLTESEDAQNCFASNTFTAPRTGFYRLTAKTTTAGWVGSAGLSVRCAGTCPFGVSNFRILDDSHPGGSVHFGFTTADVYMAAGQTLFLQLWHSNPTGLTFNTSSGTSYVSILEQ